MTDPKKIAQGIYWDQGITLVSGCTPVSAGCAHCWSASLAHRFQANPFYAGLTNDNGSFNGRARFNEHLLKRFETKKPTTFSVWNDLFNEGILFSQIAQTFAMIAQNQQHRVLILTKRPERALEFYNSWDMDALAIENHTVPPIPNLWIGTSVENQQTADERIPILLQIPAAVRFVSYEPALEEVDFTCLNKAEDGYWYGLNILTGVDNIISGAGNYPGSNRRSNKLDWLLTGAETGQGKRPADDDWFRKVRDQCLAADIPFFLKKLSNGSRLLDGVEWNQFPEAK